MRHTLPVALCVALFAATPALASDISRHNTLAQIDAAIRKAAPVGGEVGPALAYLDANHVENSDQARERTVYAIIRGIRGGSFLIEKSASIRIIYDERRRVTEVRVYADYTGP
ncbi:hypothetical protein [Caulobacter sp. LARHSG274]